MFFCKVLLLLALDQLLGVGVSGFRLTKREAEVRVNIRQNASLQWNYEIEEGESYSVLWGTSKDGTNVEYPLFNRRKGQTAQPSAKMPTKFVGRLKIIKQATLFIQRVDLSDEGFYVCQISGEFRANRERIKLLVIDPPRILPLLPPKDKWTEGEKRELACHTDGRPKPRVTWKKGNKILKQERKVPVTKLDFPSVTWRDAGLYTCLAENAGGRTQREIIISVVYAPKGTSIKTDAPQDTVSDGSYITITCEAHGNPRPEYKFYIGDKRINDRKAERSGVLILMTVGFSQSGIYGCEPENEMGNGPRKEITVYVRHSPTIVKHPDNKKVRENGQVSIRCEAEGFPAPTIKWVKLLGNRLIRNGTKSLFISNVQRSDQGWYRCIASNGFGNDDVAEFEITVYYSPRINRTASSQNVPAWSGTTANLSCVADGNPAPKYTWTNSSGTVATSEVSGLLRVTPQGADGFGPYTCTVQNHMGTDSLAISLVKVDRPVVQLKLQSSSDDSLSFTWSLLSDEKSNLFLQYYILQYRTVGSKPWINTVPHIPPQKTNYRLSGLKPYTEYEVQLLARNEHFTSDPSSVRARTTEAKPSPPRNVQVYPINGTAIHVKWNPPQSPNGPLMLYTVLYAQTDDFLGDDLMRLVTVMPNVTEAFIGGLIPFTNYTVKVKVKNSVSDENSKAVYLITMTAAPSKPLNNEANSTGPHSVRLRWRKPRELNGLVVLFKIRMLWRFKNVKGEYKINERIIPAKVSSKARKRRSANGGSKNFVVLQLEPERVIDLRKLQPYAIISMRVAEGTRDAKNNVLWGPFSNNQTVETEEGAPSVPRNVALTDKKATSVKVTWQAPEYPNGIIKKYSIIYSFNAEKNYTIEVTKGLKNATLFYTITGLKKDTNYLIYVQAFTSNYPGQISSPVSRLHGKKTGDVLEHTSVDNSSLYGGVFAGIIALAFVIIIAVIVIRKHRRRRDSTELDGKRYAVANSNDSGIGDKESLDRVPGVKYLQGVRRGSEDVVGPGKFVTIKPIPVEKLRDYCEINHADNNKSFREEFVSIRVPGHFTWENSQKPENKPKNRYKSIIPYDHTRVTLAEVEGCPGSDYINANFIDGYNHHCKFIATQGPVANTFGDFWRTVWDQGVCVIVMVTNIVEGGRIKCLKYWPSSSPEMYGPMLVSPGDEEELADYVVRKFSIQMTSDSAEYHARQVTQYHFTSWPDQGVPVHATSLLAFLRKVRASVPEDSGPILTHCSAGVGRTGTYIVLDAMMDQIAAEGVVDIYGFVSHIRQQRSSMVQTEAQYIFIHDALMEYVTCGNTEFPVRELPEKLRVLNTIDPDSGDSLLVVEFKNLCLGDSDWDSFINASQPENKAKNRYAILPFDRTRVTLWPYTGLVGSDYINASFVDSFQQREAFIATQAPLDSTVVDFWRMIWEYEAYSVVMLCTLNEIEQGQCAYYLPRKEEFIVFGLLMIEVEAEEQRNGFCRRHLKITNTKSGEIRSIYHFHFTDWAERCIPLNGVGLLDMMKCITRVQQQTGNGPVVIHCSDGSGRTGTFCSVNITLERVKLDGTIDMFQTVRRLRTQRPLMVQTAEQYKFCYEITRLFVDSYGDYANFK